MSWVTTSNVQHFFSCSTLMLYGHLLALVDQGCQHFRLHRKSKQEQSSIPEQLLGTQRSKGAEVFGYKPWAICVYSSHLETAHRSGSGGAGELSVLQKTYLFQRGSSIRIQGHASFSSHFFPSIVRHLLSSKGGPRLKCSVPGLFVFTFT